MENIQLECPFCGEIYENEDLLYKHIKENHPDENYEFYTKDIETDKNNRTRTEILEIVRCKHCYFFSSAAKGLIEHIKKYHRSEQTNTYYCGDCDRDYYHKNSFEFHLNEHLDVKPYSCNYCNYTARVKEAVTEHKKRDHSEKTSGSNYSLQARLTPNVNKEENPMYHKSENKYCKAKQTFTTEDNHNYTTDNRVHVKVKSTTIQDPLADYRPTRKANFQKNNSRNEPIKLIPIKPIALKTIPIKPIPFYVGQLSDNICHKPAKSSIETYSNYLGQSMTLQQSSVSHATNTTFSSGGEQKYDIMKPIKPMPLYFGQLSSNFCDKQTKSSIETYNNQEQSMSLQHFSANNKINTISISGDEQKYASKINNDKRCSDIDISLDSNVSEKKKFTSKGPIHPLTQNFASYTTLDKSLYPKFPFQSPEGYTNVPSTSGLCYNNNTLDNQYCNSSKDSDSDNSTEIDILT